MILRPVRAADIPAVSAIYNHYVLNATCTFATEPEGEAYWRDWLAAHDGAHPAIVAEDSGQVVGWGSLSRWNNRCAYRFSVEDSVYIRTDQHRRGIGRLLLTELVALARTHGHRNIVAQIADHQPASEKLHEALGFRQVGVLEAIGFKFDRWIDVAIWQLRLDGD
ncbi:MAG TPA: GNAT family N-acetyltransferase [Phycisphaerae bacterium]|nr:GNAT family N-acetyltransferase [Phycisphaerae bacterium]